MSKSDISGTFWPEPKWPTPSAMPSSESESSGSTAPGWASPNQKKKHENNIIFKEVVVGIKFYRAIRGKYLQFCLKVVEGIPFLYFHE